MDMHHGHRHTAWTCSMDIDMQSCKGHGLEQGHEQSHGRLSLSVKWEMKNWKRNKTRKKINNFRLLFLSKQTETGRETERKEAKKSVHLFR